ncbi:hypothetical protein KC318_g2250 [Hortaea werneckii]|nr:hypothetical protein KC334_g4681 [Hortaea werneckii]KAI7010033.1 hypothetical protein KC355_g6341 [Hortaea werneckii]KAI7673423.1 hypothetical protein KC318_g2250 [Hortaea werneckii]
MEQSRALNALAPFLALAKSATSPRAAADLVTQATAAPNTYVFAELLQHPQIQALAGHEQFGGHYELLKLFAWGTWEEYSAAQGLPQLSDAQTTKLKLLSLLTIASQKPTASSTESNLSYTTLCSRLDLQHPIDLEHLVTQAIYNDLITATLNPDDQTVVITSVAPLRDLAPGSVASMMNELAAWSGRCDAALGDLEREMEKIKAAMEGGEKSGSATAHAAGGRNGHNTRGAVKRAEESEDDGDAMELDGGNTLGGGGGRKRSGGGGAFGNIMGKVTGGKAR